ncbi:MAG TPA: HEAT repeat domain-containing protein [Gemmataceae bacterium]|nr:HEAT repeat domain-containing protein [Gemmataceae bacterium]
MLRNARTIVMVLCVGITVFCLPTLARANDGVEKLKKALKNGRWQQAVSAADRLNTISELRRAYFFTDWLRDAPLDDRDLLEKARARVEKRLTEAVRRAALTPDADRQIAACILIAELAETEQPDQRSPAGKFASRFTDILVGKKGNDGLVRDADVRIRQAAIHALGKITPPPGLAVPALRLVLKQDELGPRRLAAYALSDLVRNASYRSRADEWAVINAAVAEAVAQLGVANQDEQIRGYSIQAIIASSRNITEHRWTTQYKAAEDPIQFELDKKTDKLMLETPLQDLLQSYRAAMPRLVGALESDPSPNIKLTALESVNQIVIARFKITEKLQEKQGKPLIARSELLRVYHAPDPVDPLLTGSWQAIPGVLKSSNDIRLKRGAMSLLERIAEDIDASIESKKLDKKVTENMLRQFVRAMTPALRDPDRFVRWTAARTLRYLSPEYFDEEVILGLGQMLIDPEQRDPDLTMAAAVTLEAVAAAPYAARAVRYLRSAVGDSTIDTRNRVAAMKALVAIGGKAASEAFPEVTSAVSDNDAIVRREACLTLGQLGQADSDQAYRAAVAALKAALRDDDAEVRLNASEAILTITPPR